MPQTTMGCCSGTSSKKKSCCSCCCRNDQWSCGCCQYPNGATRLLPIQILLFVGVSISTAVILDCQLVVADSAAFEEEQGGLFGGVLEVTEEPRGFGLVALQVNGKCYCDHVGGTGESGVTGTFEEYREITGDLFSTARSCAISAMVLAWLLWFWSLSFTCAAWPRSFRLAFAALHFLVVFLECLVFVSFSSGFCDENDCKIGRTGGLAIGAILMYSLSGCLALSLKNYEHKHPSKYTVSSVHIEEEDDEPYHEPVFATVVDGAPLQEGAVVNPGDPPMKPGAYQSTIPIVHVAIQ